MSLCNYTTIYSVSLLLKAYLQNRVFFPVSWQAKQLPHPGNTFSLPNILESRFPPYTIQTSFPPWPLQSIRVCGIYCVGTCYRTTGQFLLVFKVLGIMCGKISLLVNKWIEFTSQYTVARIARSSLMGHATNYSRL